EIGYPVLVKAVSGGGGRGMRVAHNDMSLRAGLQAAQAEAQAAFGDGSVYLDNSFYFIEVNARIQVEHPVTELVTGIDLVKEQIRLATGERLGYDQDDVRHKGCAIEVRINAEDPANGFRASPGKVTAWMPAGGPGVRVDSHVYPGYVVPPNYDSLIAKLIVHKPTRRQALAALDRCLDEFT